MIFPATFFPIRVIWFEYNSLTDESISFNVAAVRINVVLGKTVLRYGIPVAFLKYIIKEQDPSMHNPPLLHPRSSVHVACYYPAENIDLLETVLYFLH